MKINAPSADDFVYLSDAYLLLTIGIGAEVSTSLDVLQFEAASTKAGNSLSVEALAAVSFKLELPSFLVRTIKH